jgi:hypothetical protein
MRQIQRREIHYISDTCAETMADPMSAIPSRNAFWPTIAAGAQVGATRCNDALRARSIT